MTELDEDLDDLVLGAVVKDDIEKKIKEKNLSDNKEEEIDNVAPPNTLQSVIDNINLEDFDLKTIINYSYKKGYLFLLYELKNREIISVSFD